jgi:hypothetical protein
MRQDARKTVKKRERRKKRAKPLAFIVISQPGLSLNLAHAELLTRDWVMP